MGMDVYGANEGDEIGGYFRRSMWGWRPIADYVTEVHADLAEPCTYWQSNDGDGLDAEQSKALGEALLSDIATGTAVAYIDQREARLKDLAPLPCPHCGATGARTDAVGVGLGMDTKLNPHTGSPGWCNGCDGRGTQPHWDTQYSLEIEDLQEFAEFCIASGGFEIH